MTTKLITATIYGVLAAASLAGCAGGDDAKPSETDTSPLGSAVATDAGTREQSKEEISQRGWAQPKALSREDFQRHADGASEDQSPKD